MVREVVWLVKGYPLAQRLGSADRLRVEGLRRFDPVTQSDRAPAHFFLEADRGTMPVTRQNLSHSSFQRKLLAYHATWKQGLHKTRFGFPRFRVLTVTTNAERMQSMIDACGELDGGHGLFLFAEAKSLLIQMPFSEI